MTGTNVLFLVRKHEYDLVDAMAAYCFRAGIARPDDEPWASFLSEVQARFKDPALLRGVIFNMRTRNNESRRRGRRRA